MVCASRRLSSPVSAAASAVLEKASMTVYTSYRMPHSTPKSLNRFSHSVHSSRRALSADTCCGKVVTFSMVLKTCAMESGYRTHTYQAI